MKSNAELSKKSTQRNVYALITEKVIEHLEKGIVPWRKSWTDAGIPTGLMSRKPYRGINVMLLAALGYERNVFLTENQLKDVGGTIRPGERPHMITYWNNKQEDGKEKDGVLSYYLVYNVAQCAGIPTELIPAPQAQLPSDAICEQVIAEVMNGPVIKYKDPKPYYDPIDDYVNMPKLKTYESSAGYYQDLLHQLIHSTGHHTRLDRMGLVQMSEHGSNMYSLEELVAEIGTTFLGAVCGITSPFEAKPAYLQGWIAKLQKDAYLIFTAASAAQRAADFILNIKAEEEPVKEEGEITVA